MHTRLMLIDWLQKNGKCARVLQHLAMGKVGKSEKTLKIIEKCKNVGGGDAERAKII